MHGVTTGSFAPQSPFTRAELADLRFAKEPLVSDLYSDVAQERGYADAVMVSGYHGLLDPTENRFRPDEPVTRLETVLAVTRAFRAKKVDLVTTLIWPGYADIEGLSGEATGAVNTVLNQAFL